MFSSVQLRREAGELVDRAKAIQAKADEENRKLKKEEEEEIKACLADADEKLAEAKRREAIEEADAKLAASRSEPESTVHGRDDLGQEPGKEAGFSKPAAEPRDPEKEGRAGFQSAGEFFQCVERSRSGQFDQRLVPLAASGGSQGVGSEGGFLVPTSFAMSIWDGLRQNPLDILSRTNQWAVEGDMLKLPRTNETSRVGGTVYGGVTANWIEEAETITATKPTYARLSLEPKELAVAVYQTDKLLRNSPIALEQFLLRAATEAIGFAVGAAIIDGNGVGKPLGILQSGGLVTVAKESGQAADTILFLNIVKMFARLHAVRRANSVWLINQDAEPELLNLSHEGTSSSTPAYLPAGGLSAAPFATLLGRPVLPIEHCKTVGDKGDIILVDLSAYATGLRGGGAGGIRTASSIHVKFLEAETAFRFMFEIDGQPWLDTPLTPANGATLSTHVALADRA